MIHKQTLIYSLIIAILLSSCFPYKEIQQKSKTLAEYNKTYVNDSLRFSYSYATDFYPVMKRWKIYKLLKKSKIKLKTRYCLAAYTAYDPDLEQYLFYFPERKTALHQLEKMIPEIKETDIDNAIVYADSVNSAMIKVLPLSQSVLAIVGKSKTKFWINLRPEFTELFESIKYGNDYDDISFSQPFILASDVRMDRDSVINYLAPVKLLTRSEQNYRKKYHFSYLQARNTFQSFLTNNSNQKSYLLKWRNNYKKKDKLNYNYTNDSAINYIVDRCKNENIVMFNENHFASNGRILLYTLLKRLKEEGFTYLGLEALSTLDSNLTKRGFVTTKSGFYTCEPMMSNLIRKAIELNFSIFAYDDFSSEREKKQAQNIYRQTFQNDPAAKVLILAGFDHIEEKSKGKGRMAKQFMELYNIDPLTINQSEYYTDSDNFLAIIDTSSTPHTKPFSSDIYLDNNMEFEDISKDEIFQEYSFDYSFEELKLSKTDDYIINIYRESEYKQTKQAIPVYNYVVNGKKFPKTINLPVNQYVYTIRDKGNRILFSGGLK